MMRLRKLFQTVESMDAETAKTFIQEHEEGTFTLLDVRQPSEYEEAHIPGAKLIPLPELHHSVKGLPPDRPIIVHCAVGGRSRVAAQLLSGLGFKEVYNLKGGIKAWQGLTATGPTELNLDLVRGDETPAEIVALAYDMEDCVQTFYNELHQRAEDPAVKELFAKLASIEEKHKKTLLELSAQLQAPGSGPETARADSGRIVLEGGFDMVEFMARNEPMLDTVPNVIELAMMLETQALDLYLRFAAKSADPKSKDVLFKIAHEEKAHLAALGRLMGKKD
ncbi:MAG: sulfurtransferase [Deltaproteobacteria bacterium]|nr:MAG: sulfurtransferase [Deltaproteobacteria bacterium]